VVTIAFAFSDPIVVDIVVAVASESARSKVKSSSNTDLELSGEML